MRVISGYLGGRQFDPPKTNRTHPMSERMRGAMFNSLGDIEGLTVLDCFGGTGALSIEALSRGAKNSIITEVDKIAHQTIEGNLKKLGLTGKAKVIRTNVSSWSDNNPDMQFDLVFCNPPFDDLKRELIEKLTRHIRLNGVMVLSWPTSSEPPKFDGIDLLTIKEHEYGDAMLAFYKKTG